MAVDVGARVDSAAAFELDAGSEAAQQLLLKDKPVPSSNMAQQGTPLPLLGLVGWAVLVTLFGLAFVAFAARSQQHQPQQHQRVAVPRAAAPVTPGAAASAAAAAQHSRSRTAGASSDPAAGRHPQFYAVGNSSVPGAGVGLFARRDIPKGTIWNSEDALANGTIILNGKQWRAILGLAEHLTAAGYAGHPLVAVVRLFDTYGYPCSADRYVVSLSPSTFVNHAPAKAAAAAQGAGSRLQAPPQPASLPPPSPTTAPAASAAHSQGPSRRGSSSSVSGPRHHSHAHAARTANSGGLPDGAPWVKKLGDVEQCVLSITLRDVKAGEELLEDYSRYCGDGEDCDAGPDFITDAGDYLDDDDEEDDRRRSLLSSQAAADSATSPAAAASTRVSRRSLSSAAPSSAPAIPLRPGSSAAAHHAGKAKEREHHHPLVQLPGVRIGRSTVPGAVGGLGLFAAADLPAGTVWNKVDSETSLVVTRGQWDTLLTMQTTLAAIGVTKPIVNNMIDALRTLGYCCPASGAMHVPLTASVFANAPTTTGGAANSGLQLHASTGSGPVSVRDACAWSHTLRAVAKGEEMLDDRWQHGCSWPGFAQAISVSAGR